jgi:hypothetical protein
MCARVSVVGLVCVCVPVVEEQLLIGDVPGGDTHDRPDVAISHRVEEECWAPAHSPKAKFSHEVQPR